MAASLEDSMVRRSVLVLAIALVGGACSGASPSPSITATSPPEPSDPEPSQTAEASLPPVASEDPLSSPAVSGQFQVSDGRKLALECWGQGSPTVVLEGGHPSGGIDDFRGTEFVEILARETRTCAYARAGYSGSDPAPNEPRDADDVIADLDDVLQAAAVEGPYVLVGSSFGGMIVTYYAARHPDDVAGVVLLDVPAPSAELTTAEIPEIAWDHPENPEHVDVVPEFETRFARERLPIEAPLTVVTAAGGQSDVEDQGIWLAISPDATQVELAGGHDIYRDDPRGAAGEVLKLVEAAR